ncbi:MAG: hypothetical protein WC476_01245 [Phycisphaerae bacterium]|jgi:hypothetical protein
MDPQEVVKNYITNTIKNLVALAGDNLVFETFVEIWSPEVVYNTVAQLMTVLNVEKTIKKD